MSESPWVLGTGYRQPSDLGTPMAFADDLGPDAAGYYPVVVYVVLVVDRYHKGIELGWTEASDPEVDGGMRRTNVQAAHS